MEKEKQKAMERERLEMLRKQELEARKQAEDEARAVLNPSKSKFVSIDWITLRRVWRCGFRSREITQLILRFVLQRIRIRKRKPSRISTREAYAGSSLWKRATIALRISLFDRENRDSGTLIRPSLIQAPMRARLLRLVRSRSCKSGLGRKFYRMW